MRKALSILSILVIINLLGCAKPEIKNAEIKHIKEDGKIQHIEVETEKYVVELNNKDGITGIVEEEYNYGGKLLRKIKFP